MKHIIIKKIKQLPILDKYLYAYLNNIVRSNSEKNYSITNYISSALNILNNIYI